MARLYKYQGAGNDFLISDEGNFTAGQIQALCDRRYGIGADGLMILRRRPEGNGEYSFGMEYFNSDGSGGMMCGNGGRCIAAFAADLGLFSGKCSFIAPDGPHSAELLGGGSSFSTVARTVRIGMKDVEEIEPLKAEGGTITELFMDTGTRHFVRIVDDVRNYDVIGEGRRARNDERFAPVGANANFVEETGTGSIAVRTFEKGVEDETFACGTGIVASAISAYVNGAEPLENEDGSLHFNVSAKRDKLAVDFCTEDGMSFFGIRLTGPATFVATIEIPEN